jgi:hypothetical protein
VIAQVDISAANGFDDQLVSEEFPTASDLIKGIDELRFVPFPLFRYEILTSC